MLATGSGGASITPYPEEIENKALDRLLADLRAYREQQKAANLRCIEALSEAIRRCDEILGTRPCDRCGEKFHEDDLDYWDEDKPEQFCKRCLEILAEQEVDMERNRESDRGPGLIKR